MKGGGDQKRAQRRRKVCCAAVLVYLCAAGNLHPVMLYKQKISILHNQICLFYSRQHGCAHASCCHATTGNRLRFIATVARNAVADTGQPHWSEAGTRKNTFLTLFLFALSLSLSLSLLQGLSSAFSGPIWGLISDAYNRKVYANPGRSRLS